MAANQDTELIAELPELEAFCRLPAEERQLTARLKGVLAETACTGVIRYKWSLVRPLVVHLMEVQLKDYEAAEHVDVGPARPLLPGDDSVAALNERFASLLWSFQGPPWTLQRLCELLLEPRKQYQRLHKFALALEKLLLVTGELDISEAPGPLPQLSLFANINEAPVSIAPAGGDNNRTVGQKRQRPEDAEAGGLVAAALTVKQPAAGSDQHQGKQQLPQQQQQQAGPAADGQAQAEVPTTMDVDHETSPGSSNSMAQGAAIAAEQPAWAPVAAAGESANQQQDVNASTTAAAAGATSSEQPGSASAAAEGTSDASKETQPNERLQP